MTRTITILALGVSAVALCACAPTVNYNGFEVSTAHGAPLKVAAALDCPATEGALTRTARAPDGRSCDYEGPDGQSVRLHLVALAGRSAPDAMAPTKAELHALVPLRTVPVPPIGKDEVGERADIDLPFFHVHTAGDRADVRIFGVKVHSDGENAEVHTNLGLKHTVVHAGHDGAEIVAEDIGRENAELVYVLASDHRSMSGYRAVGYVAKGPRNGPLVVGEFRVTRHMGHDYSHGDNGDVGRLVDRNLRS